MNFLNLKAVLSLNGSGFALGLKRAESASKQFAKEIKGQFAQAFGAAAIAAYGVKIINMADNIIDLSETLGISTKALQEWNYAAQKSGSTIEKVTSFLDNLAKARERAMGGDADAIANLNALGVSDVSMPLDQMGRTIGRKVASGDFSRVALQGVGGKGATMMIPTLSAIDELTDAAHRAGKVLNDETLEALKQMKSEAQGLSDVFSGPMANALVFMAAQLRNGLTVIKAGTAAGAAFLGYLNGQKGGNTNSDMDAAAAMGVAGLGLGRKLSGGGAKGAFKAASDAFDEVVSEWEQIQKRIDAQVAARAGGGGSGAADVLHSALPKKAAEKAAQSSLASINTPSLTAWQSAGAAIRFSPDKKALDDIAKHTRETAMNTRPSNKQAGLGIGGLGAELQ